MHLEQLLEDHPDRPVVLVRGPAGAGKTVLVAQWVAAHGGPCAWVALDAADNDPDRLLWHLGEVVARLAPERSPGAAGRSPPSSSGGACVVWQQLERVSGTLDAEVTLVLDDVHHLSDDAALHILGQLVEHPPGRTRVVLISRRKPRIGLERARLRGDLVEVTPAALRFERAEIDTLTANWAAGRWDATELEQITLGWAAGLRLAQLDAVARGDSATPPQVSDSVASEYVREELLDADPDGLRPFLEVTCWLPALTEPLRAAVAGQNRSRPAPTWSELEVLPLMSVASDPGTFRYPPILRRVLQMEYVRRDSDAASAARRHAAMACRQAGELVRSIELFLEAGRADEAVEVCAELAAGGDSALRPLDELLRAFPDVMPASSSARLFYWRIRAAVAAGRVEEAGRLLAQADGMAAPAGGLGGPETQEMQIARATLAEHIGDVASLLSAVDVLLATSGATPSGAALERQAQGWRVRALVWSGDLAGARAAVRALEQRVAAVPPDHGLDLALALAHAWVGWSAGDNNATMAVAPGRRESDDSAEGTGERSLLAGAAHRERNQLAKAVPLLQRARTQATTSAHAIVAALATSELARCHHASGSIAEAMELAVAARAAHPDLPAAVDAHLRHTDVRLRLDQGDVAGARAVVNEAAPGVETQLLRARVALHGSPAETRALLEPIEIDTPRHAVQKLLLQAQLPDVDEIEASTALLAAISAGGHMGMVRTFLDEGAGLSRRLRELTLESEDRTLGRLAAAVSQELALAPLPRADRPIEQLTSRELAVLRMLPLRMSNREMAAQMYISVNTVKTHIRAIYRKLDVPHRSAAVRRAKALQLV